ncbi:ABC transporter ATP-binding protein [Hydrogenivirga caldilitoris]
MVGERKEEVSIPFGIRGEAPDPAIVVDRVSKFFGSFRALDGVSLEVRRGEVLGLLGPNGAGKTTLIKILVGLYEPSEGKVLVAGEDDPRRIKRRIGYMSQKFSLYSDLTVRENLLLWGSAYGILGGELSERIEEGLRMLRLEEFRNILVKDLPLGIKQRLGLLSSFLHGPPILFLDEPTSGVDPVERKFFWKLIKHLSEEKGVTVLVATHHMEEAEFCDRVCLLSRGRVIALDTPAVLKRELELVEGRAYEVKPRDLYSSLEALERKGLTVVPYGRRLKFFTKGETEEVLREIDYEWLREAEVSMEDVFVGRLERYEASQG